MKNKIVIYILSFILFVLVLMFFARFLYFFNIDKITILSNSEFVYNDIIDLSGVKIGQSMLTLNENHISQSIEKNPHIDVDSIIKQYPGELIIKVTERQELAYAKFQSFYVIFDNQGIVLNKSTNDHNQELIEVKGLRMYGFKTGYELRSKCIYRFNAMRSVLYGLETQNLSDKIAEIDFDDLNNIEMVSNEGIVIGLGQPVDLDLKLRWLNSELFEQLQSENRKGIFDISIYSQAIFTPYMDEEQFE